jgi:MOSC domain-containing protein YiiM
VTQTGFGGWYFRVLRPGIIQAGLQLELLERTQPTWSIARANDVLFGRLIDREALTELMLVPELSQSWKESLG